jgi:hypothetical protein
MKSRVCCIASASEIVEVLIPKAVAIAWISRPCGVPKIFSNPSTPACGSVENIPPFIENGDYFSFDEQEPFDILYGERLIAFLKQFS